MNPLELYEKKVIHDVEFPVQMMMHDIQKRGEYVTPHWHEHVEMHYIFQGRGYFLLNQKKTEFTPGTLIIANSNELHQGFCEESPLLGCRIVFNVGDISGELGEKNLVFWNAISKDVEIHSIFEKLCWEDENRQLGYKQNCKALVTQLLVHLGRNYISEMLSPEDSIRRKRNQERMNLVLMHLEENYMQPITNQELADLVFLSKDRFEHFFRENVGEPPLQFINKLRLKKAQNLIRTGEMKISEIALAVGFSDYNHFGRQFRKYYNCTPQEMRKKHNSGNV